MLVFIVGWQYKRLQRLSEGLFIWRKNISSLYGTLNSDWGGWRGLGSFILLLFGVDLSEIGNLSFRGGHSVNAYQPSVLLLPMPGDFFLFSYIFFGVPRINVPQLMGLVAILHMVESLLILVSGHLDPIPVYVKRSDGQVVEGLIYRSSGLFRWWRLSVPDSLILSGWGWGVAMPDWWPLIKAYPDVTRN